MQHSFGRVARELSTGSSVVNLDLEEDVFHLESSIADQVASSSVDKRSSTPSSSGRPILDQEDDNLSALGSPLRFERSREFSTTSKGSDVFSRDSDSPPLSPRAHVEMALLESERSGLGHRRGQNEPDEGHSSANDPHVVSPSLHLKINPIVQSKYAPSGLGPASTSTIPSSFPLVSLNRLVLLIVAISFFITAISQFQYVSRISTSSTQDTSHLTKVFVNGRVIQEGGDSTRPGHDLSSDLNVSPSNTSSSATTTTTTTTTTTAINHDLKSKDEKRDNTKTVPPSTKPKPILPAPPPGPPLAPHELRALKILSAVDEVSPSNVIRRSSITGLAHSDKDAPHHLLPVQGGENTSPVEDGRPSYIPTPLPEVCSLNGGSWDARLITTPKERDLETVLGRVNWHRGCINRREKLSPKTPLSRTAPETNPFISYYDLKRLSFKIHHISKAHFPEKEWAQAWTPFFPGPWIEDYFEHTFAHQKVRKNITLAEYYFEIEVMRPEDITLVEGCGATSDPIHFENLKLPPLSDLDTELLVRLHKDFKDCEHGKVQSEKECRQVMWPTYIDEYKANGAQWVLVEYPFDFDLFYPWIPLFLPLDRIATVFSHGKDPGQHQGPTSEFPVKYRSLMENINVACEGMLEFYQFVTVTKRAYGFEGITDTPPEDYLGRRLQLNTIVLNAGGLSDVILPLLANKHSLLSKEDIVSYNPSGIFNRVDVSFLGRIREEGSLRYKALEMLRTFQPQIKHKTTFYPPSLDSARQIEKSLKWPSWVEDMRQSSLQLAPSGVNPTSFRLFETLMLGLVPIFLHSKGHAWNRSLVDQAGFAADFKPPLPYHDFTDGDSLQLWDRISILVSLPEFNEELLPILGRLVRNSTWLVGMHENVRAARDSYFTHEAVMQHVYRFLRDPWTSELYCYN
jgi:hypothetical protein